MAQGGQTGPGKMLGVAVSRPTLGGVTIGTSTGPTAVIDLGYNGSSKIGAYGTTPVTQRSTTLGTTVVTTVPVSTTTGTVTSWGFSTSSQAANIVTMLNDIYGALTSIGFIST